jgi:hypothetical protein
LQQQQQQQQQQQEGFLLTQQHLAAWSLDGLLLLLVQHQGCRQCLLPLLVLRM